MTDQPMTPTLDDEPVTAPCPNVRNKGTKAAEVGFVDGWMQARWYFGSVNTDDDTEHGAECESIHHAAACTCDTEQEVRAEATEQAARFYASDARVATHPAEGEPTVPSDLAEHSPVLRGIAMALSPLEVAKRSLVRKAADAIDAHRCQPAAAHPAEANLRDRLRQVLNLTDDATDDQIVTETRDAMRAWWQVTSTSRPAAAHQAITRDALIVAARAEGIPRLNAMLTADRLGLTSEEES